MVGYDVAQMDDVDDEERVSPTPKQKARPWRLLGLAVAIAGTLGAIVGTVKLQQSVSPMNRLSMFHKNLLKAFSARNLQDAANFKGVMEFIFAEEGQEDFDNMGIDISIEAEEEEADSAEPKELTVTMTWLAQEGKGDDLKSQFQKILDVLVEVAGDDAPPQLKEVELANVDDKVSITLQIPPPPEDEEEMQQEENEAFEGAKPKFTASLWTGRTFPEMYENSKDSILTLPQGMKGHADLSFNSKVFDVLNQGMGMRPHNPRDPDAFGMMGAVSTLRLVHEVRYRTTEEIADAAQGLPSFDEVLDDGRGMVASMPPDLTDAMKDLSLFADGLDNVEVTGIPHNYVLNAKFTNFHITPVLKSLINEVSQEISE